jgi:hypothetical protein
MAHDGDCEKLVVHLVLPEYEPNAHSGRHSCLEID